MQPNEYELGPDPTPQAVANFVGSQVETPAGSVTLFCSPWMVEEIRGVLARFTGRAEAWALDAALRGASDRRAAVQMGKSLQAFQRIVQRDAEFATAFALCKDAGFAQTYEAELHRIALDRQHKGQVRALELVIKQRDHSYRDKQTVNVAVINQAAEARGSLTEGWQAASLDVIDAPKDSE